MKNGGEQEFQDISIDLAAPVEKKDKRWLVELPDTAEKLLRGRRRKMIRQEHMAAYLGISRYMLNRMESGERPIPREIALKAQERLNRYERDCSTQPSTLVRIFRMDGYSMQRLADVSGLSRVRIKAIDCGSAVTADELEALLRVPPKPDRVRDRRR